MASQPPEQLHPQPGGGAVKSKRICMALEPEAWATQAKRCSFCSHTDSAKFMYVNNKSVEQPRYKCLKPRGGCGKLFSPNKIRPKRFPNGYHKAYVVQEMPPIDSSMLPTQRLCHQVQVRDVNVMDTDSLNGASTSRKSLLASKVGLCPDQNQWDNFAQELEDDLSSSDDLHTDVPPSKENGSEPIASSSVISPLEGPCLEPSEESRALSMLGNAKNHGLNDINDVMFSNIETGEPAAASSSSMMPALDVTNFQFMDYDTARMWFSYGEEWYSTNF